MALPIVIQKASPEAWQVIRAHLTIALSLPISC